ncbi:MAG: dihydrofolate reductase [Capnocytophaga sp.]|nr:dihydrofolate reductase [Capnocytophaga sp.]
MITLIAAASENNALGYEGNLLWHLPGDFKHFKSLTTGHAIIMGRKTFETFPKLLPQRTHIIVSRQAGYSPDGCIVCGSLEEAVAKALETDPNPYIIGGGQIYALAMPLADRIELTRVHAVFGQADAFFPAIDPEVWQKTNETFHPADERHLYDFTFETYIRK